MPLLLCGSLLFFLDGFQNFLNLKDEVPDDRATRLPPLCNAQSATLITCWECNGLLLVIRICLIVETSKHVVFIGIPFLLRAALLAHSLDLIESHNERPAFVRYDVSETLRPAGIQRVNFTELAQEGPL